MIKPKEYISILIFDDFLYLSKNIDYIKIKRVNKFTLFIHLNILKTNY